VPACVCRRNQECEHHSPSVPFLGGHHTPTITGLPAGLVKYAGAHSLLFHVGSACNPWWELCRTGVYHFMAKEAISFWDSLETLFLRDDRARWYAIGFMIITVGTAGSIQFALFDSSVEDAVFSMSVLILLIVIVGFGSYCIFLMSARGGNALSKSRVSEWRPATAAAADAILSIVAVFSSRFPAVEANVVADRLELASKSPLDPHNAEKAKQALSAAQVARVKIDGRIVARTGDEFLQNARLNPEVWPTVQEYLGYRSFLNEDLAPALTPASGKSNYRESVNVLPPSRDELRRQRGRAVEAFRVSFAGGHAAGNGAARLENLNDPQPEGSEFKFFIIDGGESTIVLDDEYMKNVIIRNSNVSYSGRMIRLENVWLVNCSFDNYSLTEMTISLGRTILADGAVSFGLYPTPSSEIGFLENPLGTQKPGNWPSH